MTTYAVVDSRTGDILGTAHAGTPRSARERVREPKALER